MPIKDICFTANTGRSHFGHRLATVVATSDQLRDRLRAFAAVGASDDLMYGRVNEGNQPRIAFLFTSQCSHYAGMGRLLYETQPTFRKALEQCEELLQPYLEKPLLSVLYPRPGEASSLDDPSYSQPALFVMEYGLTQILRSWGIEPSAVMGHGIGEYAAAHVAGVISLEDSLKLVAERGRMFCGLPCRDSIASSLAEQREFFASTIPDQALNAFRNRVREMSFAKNRICLASSVLGRLAKDEMTRPEYWQEQIYPPARLSGAMKALKRQGCGVFVEVGPGQTLLEAGKRAVQEPETIWLPTLTREKDDWRSILASLSTLYVNGISIDWSGFDRDYRRKKPSSPFIPLIEKRIGPRTARMSSSINWKNLKNISIPFWGIKFTPRYSTMTCLNSNATRIIRHLSKTTEFMANALSRPPRFWHKLQRRPKQFLDRAATALNNCCLRKL